MVWEALPAWLVSPAKLIVVVLTTVVVGRLLVRPGVQWAINRTDPALRGPVARLAYYVFIVMGLIAGLNAAGYGQTLGVFGTIVAASTVAIGFAMQDTLSSFVAGIFLLLDKPFEIGDWIEWDDFAGRVRDIGIRTTKVETFDNELLTVPNRELANTTVKNPVANDKLRTQITIGIGYSDDISEASRVIKEHLDDIDGILDEPAPDVRLTNLGDSAVDLKARYWTGQPARRTNVNIRADLLQRVKESFDKKGIDMPYPTQTIAGDSLSVE